MYGGTTTTNEPVRETELSREMNRLGDVISNLESIKDRYCARLEGILNGGGLKNVDSAKTPENSSKLGQELNSK
ncbi:MAG: hypothetical protein AABY22_26835, partial [Nanoarchaeota archaeon]